MRWFRFYDEALNDPKVQRLSPELFKTWVNLLCLASKGAEGKLPNDDDVAYHLRISAQDAAQRVQDLILAGLVDIGPRGERMPHNWGNRQYASDSSADRTRKYRDRQKKKSGDVTVTPAVTPQNRTESESEEESLVLPSSSAAAPARAPREERGFDSGLDEGKADGKIYDSLTRRAEGFGLDAADLIATVNERRPKNRTAYFTKLCVTQLMAKLPGVKEGFIRDALWGKEPAYGAVMRALTLAVTP